MTELFANEEIGPYDHTVKDGPKAFGFPDSHKDHPDMVDIATHFEKVFRKSIADEKLPVLSEMVEYIEKLNCHERIKLQVAVSIGASLTKFENDFARLTAINSVAKELGIDVVKMSTMDDKEREAYLKAMGENLAEDLMKNHADRPTENGSKDELS